MWDNGAGCGFVGLNDGTKWLNLEIQEFDHLRTEHIREFTQNLKVSVSLKKI